MERRTLGRTGLAVSVLGFGATTPEPGQEGAKRFRAAIRAALDAGITLFDTAACYGESESLLGEELRSVSAGDAIIVSKCGHHDVLPDGKLRSRTISEEDIDSALHRLNREVIDVMLLHSYDLDLLIKGDAISVLVNAKKKGKIRHLGYSGDGAAALYAAGLPSVEVIELSVNLVDQANLLVALERAQECRTGVLTKRSLANAVWRQDRAQDHPEYARRWKLLEEQLSRDEAVTALMNHELAVRFVLTVPGVTAALVGTRSPVGLLENMAAAALGPLSSERYRAVRAAYAKVCGIGGAWLPLN